MCDTGKKPEVEEEKKLTLWDEGSNDQLVKQRVICLNGDHHVMAMFEEFEQCQQRVKGKDYTAETCHQEMKDLITAVDHCVGSKAFRQLK